MYRISKAIHYLNRFRRRLLVFFAVLGPGIIVMVADNDAGGISTYAVTGSRFGFSLLWIFVLLFPIAFYAQEMTVRVGAVTKRGLAEVIFDGFGSRWGWFSLAGLALVSWLTLVTEYVGMTAGMRLLGVPPPVTVVLVTAVLFGIVLSGKYWTFEKITLVFCAFNLVYVPAAIWAMETPTAPAWNRVLEGFLPNRGLGFSGDLLFFVLANIGTTVAPWQLYFQQSAVVDKGLDIHDVRFGRLDTLVGTALTCLVAVFIIITTAAAFHYHVPPITIHDAAQTADALVPLLPHSEGLLARKLFAIGLFDAGFLGALCVSLATSWAVGEVFGWAHSLNASVRDAPWFYAIYLGMLTTAAAVVLIPGAPLVEITMYVQVVAVTLLPSLMVFLLLILNDEAHMGPHVNSPRQNLVGWAIVIVLSGMGALLALNTLAPGLLAGRA